MNILLTGDQGFIGSHLKNFLPAAWQYDLKSGKDVCDFNQLLTCLREHSIDIVVHLAALTAVAASYAQPASYMHHNVTGTAQLIEAALAAGVTKIVFASSAACYAPITSPYALSKYAAEQLLNTYRDRMEIVALRIFNVYGRAQSSNGMGVIHQFKAAIETGDMTIYGDGEQTRDFIHVSDVCRALQLACVKKAPSGCVLDIGTGTSTSIRKLAQMMKTAEKNARMFYAPYRQEVYHSRADVRPAKELLGFEARIVLEEGLKDVLI